VRDEIENGKLKIEKSAGVEPRALRSFNFQFSIFNSAPTPEERPNA
jgi:hypothetical protein